MNISELAWSTVVIHQITYVCTYIRMYIHIRRYILYVSIYMHIHKRNNGKARMYASGAARDALVGQSKAHLEMLEVQRKLYLRSRSVSLGQRALLYAHDELDMSMMRMQLRAPGDSVKPHEQHFRLQPFEVPLKNRVRLKPLPL